MAAIPAPAAAPSPVPVPPVNASGDEEVDEDAVTGSGTFASPLSNGSTIFLKYLIGLN